MKKYIGTALFLAAVMILIPLMGVGGLGENLKDKPVTEAGSEITEPEDDDSETPDENPEDNQEQVFRVLNKQSGEVFQVSEFDYICGTVAMEMPAEFYEEALKAQAVAAYTYADRQRKAEREKPTKSMKGADLSSDPSQNQGFLSIEDMKSKWGKSFDKYYKKISDAVNEVLGKRILYKDEPILAAYHALSAGKTETSANVWGGELPYLTAVVSPGDEQAKGYESSAEFTATELKEKLLKDYPDINFEGDESGWISEIQKSDSGTVTKIKIGSHFLTGANVRYSLGLRSACFEVNFQDDKFIFKVKGYGHGVGMSQTGANHMAKEGSTYIEILEHYYPGSEVI